MADKGFDAKNILSSLFENPVFDRVVEYIVRELGLDRELFDILEDTFVRNRIPEEGRRELLENPEILAAFEAEIAKLKTED